MFFVRSPCCIFLFKKKKRRQVHSMKRAVYITYKVISDKGRSKHPLPLFVDCGRIMSWMEPTCYDLFFSLTYRHQPLLYIYIYTGRHIILHSQQLLRGSVVIRMDRLLLLKEQVFFLYRQAHFTYILLYSIAGLTDVIDSAVSEMAGH